MLFFNPTIMPSRIQNFKALAVAMCGILEVDILDI
jgi:hypothetical protein